MNNVAIVDLRSDTVTRPTTGMMQAMMRAEVGDDVIGLDPTVTRLQEQLAATLDKQAALFMPSGTMANQVALRLHCHLGDEFLCDSECHIYHYEQGSYAQLSGLAARPISNSAGLPTVTQLEQHRHGDDDHLAQQRLLCLENTHNRAGGSVLPQETVREVCQWAHRAGWQTHLDGARLFNAAVASGKSVADLAAPFDTVSVCFSKGLGAPIGSALVGQHDTIRQARRHRKAFGGGMRQVGILAAAAEYALEHHVDRLAEDHQNAKRLANEVANIPGFSLAQQSVDTNIVYFDVDPSLGTASNVLRRLADQGVLMLAESRQRIRAVTHLDVSSDQIEMAVQRIQSLCGQ